MDKSSLITHSPLSSSYNSRLRVSLTENDLYKLKRADLVSLVMITASKTKINTVEFLDNKRIEGMFYVVSEFVSRSNQTRVPINSRYLINSATLDIEWQSLVLFLEPDDELEILWCQDWETPESLKEYDLHYDCIRIVIYKKDEKQFHFRIATVIGDSNTRLLRVV